MFFFIGGFVIVGGGGLFVWDYFGGSFKEKVLLSEGSDDKNFEGFDDDVFDVDFFD